MAVTSIITSSTDVKARIGSSPEATATHPLVEVARQIDGITTWDLGA